MAVAKESVVGQQQRNQLQHHQQQPTQTNQASATQILGEQNCCASCQMPIKDRYIFSVIEQNFHQDCVRCSDCSGALNERCYAYEGKLYCRLDYWRRFGPKCSACLEPIKPTELVQRLKDNLVYHLSCFVCQDCKRHLQAGEQLHLIDDKRLLCKRDYLNASQQGLAVSQSIGGGGVGEHYRAPSQQPASASQQQRQQQENLELLATKEEENDELGDDLDDEASSSGGQAELGELSLDYGPPYGPGSAATRTNSQGNKNKRDSAEIQGLKGSDCGDELVDANGKRRGPRTTIKPKQLETLKRAFESAPKPSRHTREQLATETGLNMRVIQVWFQNRRSKERRMKNHNGVARRSLFRTTSRRLRIGPASGAGTPTGAPPQSLIAGGRAAGKQQGAVKGQQHQPHQQQMSPMEEPQLQQQSGCGGSQGRQAPMSHNSPSDFGGSSSGGFTYFSDSSNQGDAFAINTTGHQASQQPAQQQQQYLTALKQEPIKQETSLMALEPPPAVGQNPNGGSQAPQQQQQQQQQPQQQQQQYGQHQSMKNTPPPAMFQSGGQPPPPHMMGGPQQLVPHQMMVNSRVVMQPQPAGAMSGLGPPGLLGHPQGPSVVQW